MTTIQAVVYSDNNFTGKKNYSLVVSKAPNFIYTRHGFVLLAEDDGFYSSYVIDVGSRGAFGGKEFDIPLSDGTEFKAHGQVWYMDYNPIYDKPATKVGVASIEELKQCYVFYAGSVAVEKFEEALRVFEPIEYWEYARYLKELKRSEI